MNTWSEENWGRVDWALLETLRLRLLADNPAALGDYWESENILWHYELSFGERIRWKWEAALREILPLAALGNDAMPIWDFACGPGQISRYVASVIGANRVASLNFVDSSERARSYASAAAKRDCPSLARSSHATLPSDASGILLISHVANELNGDSWRRLLLQIPQFQFVLWVEPGTPASSGRLVEARHAVRSHMHALAPCPHQERCGMSSSGHARNWCHFFAPNPPGVAHSSGWSTFARRLGIDLRALPYSFLFLSKENRPSPGNARVVGSPRVEKGRARMLLCSTGAPDNLQEGEIQKRDAPEFFKALQKDKNSTLLQGEWAGKKFIPQKI